MMEWIILGLLGVFCVWLMGYLFSDAWHRAKLRVLTGTFMKGLPDGEKEGPTS